MYIFDSESFLLLERVPARRSDRDKDVVIASLLYHFRVCHKFQTRVTDKFDIITTKIVIRRYPMKQRTTLVSIELKYRTLVYWSGGVKTRN